MSEFKTIIEPAAVTCPASHPEGPPHKCEFTLHIGLFFDGTDNNKDTEPNPSTNTNVARMWRAYKEDHLTGYFKRYVAGVGTPFTQIGEKSPPAMGSPFGVGGEERIVYGLLQVVNSVYRFINNSQDFYSLDQLAALCSPTPADAPNHQDNPPPPTPRQLILRNLGLSRGLVGSGDTRFLGHTLTGERRRFFTRAAAELAARLAHPDTRPRVTGIYLDVFGFSRGAAQARVFTSWLHQLMLTGGTLFGVPAYVRMLGLFDTVSSVGRGEPMGGSGHGGWADYLDLRIRPEVKNCVHYVALHELRTNFPLDSVSVGGAMPANCQEHFCPGAHSDVGGGYAAGEQGKGMRRVAIYSSASEPPYVRYEPDDACKLSQLPLNLMLEAARKTCANPNTSPWMDFASQQARDAELPVLFSTGERNAKSWVERYFTLTGLPAGLEAMEALRQHGLHYLAWRRALCEREGAFSNLDSVQRSHAGGKRSREVYLLGHEMLRQQLLNLSKSRATEGYSRHAPAIYAAMGKVQVSAALGEFFDDWVHDSFAGFIAKFDGVRLLSDLLISAAEGQGYVRWRGLYQGDTTQLNAMKQLVPAQEAMA